MSYAPAPGLADGAPARRGDHLGLRPLDRIAASGPLDHGDVISSIPDGCRLLLRDAEPSAEPGECLALVGVWVGDLDVSGQRGGDVEAVLPTPANLREGALHGVPGCHD